MQKIIVMDCNDIRILRSEILSQLKNLDSAYFPMPWSSYSWDAFLANSSTEKYFLLLAFDESELLVGFLLLSYSVADSFAHLLKILVQPKSRRMGLSKRLLDEALIVLKKLGVSTFFLEVEEDNIAAITFYQKSGFAVIHHKKQFFSNGTGALMMTLSF